MWNRSSLLLLCQSIRTELNWNLIVSRVRRRKNIHISFSNWVNNSVKKGQFTNCAIFKYPFTPFNPIPLCFEVPLLRAQLTFTRVLEPLPNKHTCWPTDRPLWIRHQPPHSTHGETRNYFANSYIYHSDGHFLWIISFDYCLTAWRDYNAKKTWPQHF